MSTFLNILVVLLGLVGAVWLGFLIAPRPFRPHPAPSQPGEPRPLRPDLPEPVRRHFEVTLGENPPQVRSAVVWGRGRAYVRGVWVPLRFKSWHRPGQSYARRMEMTWFRRPVLRGVDAWIDGQGIYRLGRRAESGEGIDQRQLLALWAEAVWTPSVLVHPSAARWEPVDDLTARLVVPGAEGREDSLLAHFDDSTGRMTHLSALRYSRETGQKEPWRMDLHEWRSFHGLLLPCKVAVALGESGSPWAYWSVDGIAYNVNVDDQLAQMKTHLPP